MPLALPGEGGRALLAWLWVSIKALVLTFRAGKLARREVFETVAEAREVVGLRE